MVTFKNHPLALVNTNLMGKGIYLKSIDTYLVWCPRVGYFNSPMICLNTNWVRNPPYDLGTGGRQS